MTRNYVSIEVRGTLRGPIWQGMECTKPVSSLFVPGGRAFAGRWTGLRDALAELVKCGDFQCCVVDDCELVIERPSSRPGRTILDCVAVRPSAAIADLIGTTLIG